MWRRIESMGCYLVPTLTEDESFQSYFLKYGTILAYLLIFVLFSFQ